MRKVTGKEDKSQKGEKKNFLVGGRAKKFQGFFWKVTGRVNEREIERER